MPGRTTYLLLAHCLVAHCLVVRAPRASARHGRAPRLQADGDEPPDEGNAFSAFAEAAAKIRNGNRKPGEGAPKRTDVTGLPIRLGGAVRDGSLGDLRAASTSPLFGDPRKWQAEEFGLVGAIGFVVGSLAWGYFTYVTPAPEICTASRASGGLCVQESGARVALDRQLAACAAGDERCEQEARAATDPMFEREMEVTKCMRFAVGARETRSCEALGKPSPWPF